jgi:ABC-type phosphate transport system substrate-binding protein
VADTISGEATPVEEDVEAAFADQAKAAGIILPQKARGDPWGAAVVVVALIVLTAGIGEVAGWVNLRAPATAGGSFETQTCTGSTVRTYGAVSSAMDPAFTAWLDASGQQMSQAVGGCFAVDLNATPGVGYLPLLLDSHTEFAASYGPPTPAESSQLPYPVVVLPVALSAVAVIYNLAGVTSSLNLSGPVLAGIYNGSITSWDAPAILALNPGADLTGQPPVSEFEQSGPSAANGVFTTFLAATTPSWNATMGSGLDVAWPSGSDVSSDAEMLRDVASTPGSIGYVETLGAPLAGVGTA